MMKRLFDLAVASLCLILFSPIMLVLAVMIARRMGRPVIFAQQRPGLGGRPFRMYKFRTMNDRRDADGMLLPDGERLTRLGQWLRSSSLDELPGLWNVLRGDMSLVGPRPLLMAYLDRYSPEQARRHLVRPGITGWAQVNGRNALTWKQKFELDTWYVDHRSFWLDLRILVMTVTRVIRRDDINAADAATMPEFLGEQELPPAGH
ncbi:sugar transferase [Sphingomonas sp. SORGH_AS_0879]|uniref:sugar transferase n=1 Tax=Sphingomonas sp. SORGH_AS_0879 TaxID=3041790 RepID=UPI0027843682|nr:sugar transferase [Sphingomonas sp. SORGH_AS_0879]MDQ1228613.1 lipopolysaccharide/colanic/teichoic acid biosynthesis glycosyltransferase [Sphingomonas sp. SORGH_AS_0879]